jgi:hypothetical protein
METIQNRIIHIGKLHAPQMKGLYLILRQLDPFRHVWFKLFESGEEEETSVWGGTPQEAIQTARKTWKSESFQMVNCGFRYTLPERDEHGANALFCQMAASYSSASGVYFEEELGTNCIVHNASGEARDLYKRLMK